MKLRVVGLFAVLLLVASVARAAEVSFVSVSGNFMFALFESTDASGCVITDVTLSAGAGKVHLVPGGPEKGQGLSIFIGQFDTCSQVQLLDAVGTTDNPSSFQFANDLSSASVSGTFSVADFNSGTSFLVSVNMTWTGFGASQRRAGATQFTIPGSINVVHTFNGITRMAQATGIVTLENRIGNFTPEPSFAGQLETSSQSEVDVQTVP